MQFSEVEKLEILYLGKQDPSGRERKSFVDSSNKDIDATM